MNRNYHNNKAVFSLSEMFVVIAILAILIAILLTVFQQAQEKNTRLSTCANNLHQLYMGFAMYAEDNDGRLPIYQNALGVAISCQVPACGGTGRKNLPEKGKELVEVLLPYTKSRDIWFCPSDILARTEAVDGMIKHQYSSYRTSPKLGQQLLFNESFTLEGWKSKFEPSRHDVATFPLATENLFRQDCHVLPLSEPPYSHNDRFHTLYLDGHIALLPWDACGESIR